MIVCALYFLATKHHILFTTVVDTTHSFLFLTKVQRKDSFLKHNVSSILLLYWPSNYSAKLCDYLVTPKLDIMCSSRVGAVAFALKTKHNQMAIMYNYTHFLTKVLLYLVRF